MLATPHLLVGAWIGSRFGRRRPWAAAAAAFASHFALDAVPHLDAHALFGHHGTPAGGGMTRREAAAIAADALVGVLLVAWAARRAGATGGRSAAAPLLAGAALAMLLDVADHVRPWGDWFSAWPGTAWLSEAHRACQRDVSPALWPLGLCTQAVAVLAAAASLLLVPGRAPHSEAPAGDAR